MHSFFSVALLATSAYAHGLIKSPHARDTGAASLAACGSAVTKIINADNTSHVEGLPEAAAKDTSYHADKCNLWLCKGLQFDDNKNNVLQFKTGQVVPINVFLRINHKGTANVSIVDTKSNSIVGKQLIYWSDYADETLPKVPANNSDFSVTIPDLGGKCATPGKCVLQWWWYGTGAKQTYESCLDFTVAQNSSVVPRFWKS